MITQKIIARTDSLKLDKIISRYGEDSMRQVVFIIVRPDPDSEELIPITIPEDAVGSFRILKPSGNFVIVPMSKSVLATGETAFDVVLPASANTAKGSGYYDIRITSDTDKYYFTAQGEFIIDDNIISDEVLEDVSEVNGLIFPDDFLTVEDNVAYIDDDTISTDSTWSSDKINEEIEAHARGDVSKTVSGNPVTFTDGASAPLVKCVTEIQGSQDLHGHDKPWVGGAGKNKLPMTVDGIKAINTSGTWNGNTYTYRNVDITILTDGDDNVIGFDVNRTANANLTFFYIAKNVTFDVATIYSWGSIASWNVNGYVCEITDGTTNYSPTEIGGIEIPSGTYTVRFAAVYSHSFDHKKIYPMLRISTETDSTFAPYSNICPIVAYSEGEIEVSDGDGNTTTHTTTYPSAIYRGSEDCVNGKSTTEWKKIVFDGTERWTRASAEYRIFAVDIPDIKNSATTEQRKDGIISSYFPVSMGTSIAGSMDDKSILKNNGTLFIRDTDCITASDFMQVVAGMEFAYELATPTTSSVTPTNLPIKSLSGYTHIESTTGNMEVEYITQRLQPLIDSIKQL